MERIEEWLLRIIIPAAFLMFISVLMGELLTNTILITIGTVLMVMAVFLTIVYGVVVGIAEEARRRRNSAWYKKTGTIG